MKLRILAGVLAALLVVGTVTWFAIGPKLHQLTFKVSASDDYSLEGCQPQNSNYEFGVFAKGGSSEFFALQGQWSEAEGACYFKASAWLPNETTSIKPRFSQGQASVVGKEFLLNSESPFSIDISQTVDVSGTLRLYSDIPERYKSECRTSFTSYLGGPCSKIYLGVMSYPQSCYGHRGYGEVSSGVRIKVQDGSDLEIARGALGDGEFEVNLDVARESKKIICKFDLSIEDLPKKKSDYRFTLEGVKDFVLSYSELEESNFKLDLAIGQ